MRTHTQILVTAAAIATIAAATLSADRVKLRSGPVVEGSFMSADGTRVRMLLPNGSVAEFPIADVTGVEFTARKTPPPTTTPDPARAPAPVTVPTGTVLSVLLTQAIDVDAAQAGMTFRAILDDPVMLGGKVVIPRQLRRGASGGEGRTGGQFQRRRHDHPESELRDVRRTQVRHRHDATSSRRVAVKASKRGGRSSAAQAWARPSEPSPAAAPARPSEPPRAPPRARSSPARGREHLTLPAETRLQFTLNAAVNVRP